MPPIAAAAFLVLEFVAGDGRIPHAVFAAILESLPAPSPRNSPRLRKAIALRALNAALHAEDAASTALLLLRKARVVLADPDTAACFPQLLALSLPDDEVTAAATMADLKRILDHEWASLPPSTLELTAERIAGTGTFDTWARAEGSKRQKLRMLVGDSIEREIVAKLGQDAYASLPSLVSCVGNDKSANVPGRIDANETDHAQEDGQADLSKEDNEAECAQEADNAQSHHVAASKRSLMLKDPTASTYEWDGLGHSDDERPRHRQLPPFDRKLKPSPTLSQKTKKKWSEIQEKTLLEGVEKYGKGNWKDIKMAYPGVFEDRSTVDLKDKFRNLERHQSV